MNVKYSKRLIFLLFGLLTIFSTKFELLAQEKVSTNIPEVINFSGVIIDSENNIIQDGNYTILFSLYSSQEGGSAVWTELHNNVKVQNGEINVRLGGAAIPTPLKITFDKPFFLGIKLNDDAEMTPRIELLPVPYSLRSVVANEVRNKSITSEKIVPLSVTDQKIKSISWDKIKDIPKIINKPQLRDLSNTEVTELPKYWRRYGNWLDRGNEFLGTVNDRNLVIKTDSVQRMLFDPYGKVFMGTAEDSVFFEVIGKTTLGNTYVKNRMGVGADFDETKAKLHIKTTGTQTPFRVDNNGLNCFTISHDGRVEISSTLDGAEDVEDSYPLFINGVDNGIAININGNSNSSHNYMTFWDDDGIVGRIEGMNAGDYLSDAKVIAHDVWFAGQVVALAVAYAASVAGLEIPDIINGTAEVIYWTFQTGWDLGHLGVSYKSSGADYSEWLEKINGSESFSYGDIVGVYGGKISKNTKNAEQIMSISLSPIILGNMPQKGKEQNFEKVAFKGQVPIKVKGIVHEGDYIIPSGLYDGIGVAVSPDLMTSEEFAKTVGRAWQSNDFDDVKLINVSVGLKMKDLAKCIKQSFASNNQLASLLENKNRELDSILLQLDQMDNAVKLAKTKYLPNENANNRNIMYSLNKKLNKKK